MLLRGTARLGLVIVIMLIVVSCGGKSQTAGSSPTAVVAVEDILRRTSQRLAATQTVHFTLTVDGITWMDPAKTIQLLAAQGDLARPDRVRTTVKVKVKLGVTVTVELITIGDRSWATDLITGKWGPAPDEFGYNPTVLFDNQGGIGPVLGKITNPMRLADGELDGRAVYRVTGKVTEDVIGPLTMFTMTGSPVSVSLWIDEKTNDLLRIMLVEPPPSSQPEGARWVLDLTQHDKKVTIEAPV